MLSHCYSSSSWKLTLSAIVLLVLSGCGSKDEEGSDSDTSNGPGGEKGFEEPEKKDDESDQKDDEPDTKGGLEVVVVACVSDSDCPAANACTGEQSCDDGFCLAEDRVDCDDDIKCTIDRCDPADGSCSHEAPDRDGDGHTDAACTDGDDSAIGDDCDDEDPRRFPGNSEICSVVFNASNEQGKGDGLDEDCDPATFGERDADDDGYIAAECYNIDAEGEINRGDDCQDGVRSVHPDAPEVCDYFDNNCDGNIDEGVSIVRYEDPDGDGFGGTEDPNDPAEVILVEITVCPGAVRVAVDELDCGPNDRLISPDRDELCDGVDNNCDGEIDENVSPTLWFKDADGDGYGDPSKGTRSTCARIDHEGWAIFAGDCDDSNPKVNPGQEELCDGLDNDCNPDTTYILSPGNSEDDDGDGYPDAGCGGFRLDCLDTDATVYPGALELCDGIDNDCNGFVDTQTDIANWYIDNDDDGFGDEAGGFVQSCEPVAGRITRGGDCDDTDAAVHPEALDDCSSRTGVDDDCDGDIDEGEALVAYYDDDDGDGFGSEIVGYSCVAPANYVAQGGDCNDDEAGVNPEATEICAPSDGIDQDCDGLADCRDTQCSDEEVCEALFGIEAVDFPSTIYVSDRTELTVRLTDQGGDGIASTDLFVTGDEGCLVSDGPITTDEDGFATFTVGVGLMAKSYNFLVESGSSLALAFTLEAQLPPEGFVWTVAGNGTGSYAANDFGPNAILGVIYDLALDSSGGAYLATNQRVSYVDSLGRVTRIAGSNNTSESGDGGTASQATFNKAQNIALDEVRQRLYVQGTTSIRMIDLSTDPMLVQHFAGVSGGSSVPGFGQASTLPAAIADLGNVADIAVTKDGTVLVSTSLQTYAIDPETTVVRQFLYNKGATNSTSLDPRTFYEGPRLIPRADGSVWALGRFIGAGLQAFQGTGGMALATDGKLRLVAGNTDGAVPIDDALIDSLGASVSDVDFNLASNYINAPHHLAEDSAGGLIFSTRSNVDGHRDKLFYQDPADHYIRTISNRNNQSSVGLGHEPLATAPGKNIAQMAMGSEGDLWFVESGTGRLRRARGLATATAASVDVEVLSGEEQQLWPFEPLENIQLSVSKSGATKSGVPVFVQHSGNFNDLDTTVYSGAINGLTNIERYAAPTVGIHLLSLSLKTPGGTALVTKDISYEVLTPSRGATTPWLNRVGGMVCATPRNGESAQTAANEGVGGFEVASDGTIYYTARTAGGYKCEQRTGLFSIDPEGRIEVLSQYETSSATPANSVEGDDGPVSSARLGNPYYLALDEVNDKLYIHTNNRIRVVDLNTRIITCVTGCGSDVFAEGPAYSLSTWAISDILYRDEYLYLSRAEGIDRINVNVAGPDEPELSSWLEVGDCDSEVLALASCVDSYRCQLSFLSDGTAYVTGSFCGTSLSGDVHGIAKVDASGSLVELLAGGGSSLVDESRNGLDCDLEKPRTLVNDGDGGVYFAETDRYWIRQLDKNGLVSTFSGSRSASGNVDFEESAGTRFQNIWQMNRKAGKLYVLDLTGYSIRRMWE